MLKYMVRRMWQMVPTVFGVIIITFVLFNVAGGSPAAMTLGKHVSPKTLEEFDEQRGFNKPLLLGWWTETRASSDVDLGENAGLWNSVEGVEYRASSGRRRGHIVIPPDQQVVMPVAFHLQGGTTYRWEFVYRLEGGGVARFLRKDKVDDAATAAVKTLEIASFAQSSTWRRQSAVFEVEQDHEAVEYVLEVDAPASLEIAVIKLRRRVDNPLDSQLVFYIKQLLPFWFEAYIDAESGQRKRRWMFTGIDLGESHNTNQRVTTMLKDGIMPSLTLTVPIFFAGLIAAICVSLLCAFFRDKLIDRLFVVISVALMSINYIVWIIVGQFALGYKLGWFPAWGYESWRFLLLPVLIGIVSGLGGSIRFYRTIMLDEMYKDYVRTAFAKGIGKTGVLFRHVLKNAMVPIITNVVIAIPFLYTGSLLLESFFGIPGLGYMGINAINSSDVDVVRAIVFIGAIMFVIANLLTDICYAFVDPRVKLK